MNLRKDHYRLIVFESVSESFAFETLTWNANLLGLPSSGAVRMKRHQLRPARLRALLGQCIARSTSAFIRCTYFALASHGDGLRPNGLAETQV